MTPMQAQELLAGHELVPAIEGALVQVKRLVEQCLHNDLPAVLGNPPDQCKTGCTPKAQLLMRQDDIPSLANIMHSDWQSQLEAEGTAEGIQHFSTLQANEAGDMPCPACGTVAPLVEGTCSDCGLCLE